MEKWLKYFAVGLCVFLVISGIAFFRDRVVLIGVHGVLCELAILLSLFSFRSSLLDEQSRRVHTSLLSCGVALFLADSITNGYLVAKVELGGVVSNLSELLYLMFAVGLLGFFIQSAKQFRHGIVFWRMVGIIAICYLMLSTKFVLMPFYLRLDSPTTFNVINSTLYAVVSAALFGLSVTSALRVLNLRDLWFSQSVVFLLISQFALQYEAAFRGNEGSSFADVGWNLSLNGLLLALVFQDSKRRLPYWGTSSLAGLFSVRVLLAAAIATANCLLLLGTLLVGAVQVNTAEQLTVILFVLFVLWCISNVLALKVAGDFQIIGEMMRRSTAFKPQINRSVAPVEKVMVVDRKTFLYEANQLIDSFNDLGDRQNILLEKIAEQARQVSLANLAAQVAHDIRSPLAALGAIEKDLVQVPEHTRQVVRQAVGRIRDIANNLIEQHAKAPARVRAHEAAHDVNRAGKVTERDDAKIGNQNLTQRCLLSNLIEGLVTEKRLQYRDRPQIEIIFEQDRQGYGLFAEIEATEFKRVLSNIINNSVEAIRDLGQVIVRTKVEDSAIRIEVVDNGCGIAAGILSRLGERGETFGKAGGLGLGLYHAKEALQLWGGSLSIESKEGRGTTVSLRLPRAVTPEWFVERLSIKKGGIVLTLDDDVSIHHVWKGRLESARAHEHGVVLKQVSTPKDFKAWVLSNIMDVDRTSFFVDYELLGFQETGLDLLENLGIAQQGVLVTSRFEESAIIERAVRSGVRTLPKSLAGFVPIEFV